MEPLFAISSILSALSILCLMASWVYKYGSREDDYLENNIIVFTWLGSGTAISASISFIIQLFDKCPIKGPINYYLWGTALLALAGVLTIIISQRKK